MNLGSTRLRFMLMCHIHIKTERGAVPIGNAYFYMPSHPLPLPPMSGRASTWERFVECKNGDRQCALRAQSYNIFYN